jgi:hypothetical protein
MRPNIRDVYKCFQNEPELSLSTIVVRLGQSLAHKPRRDRVVQLLSEVPSRSFGGVDEFGAHQPADRVYSRADVQEAADVEQADEERAREKKARPDRVTLQLRVPATLMAKLLQQAEARGARLSDYVISILEGRA